MSDEVQKILDAKVIRSKKQNDRMNNYRRVENTLRRANYETFGFPYCHKANQCLLSEIRKREGFEE